MLLEKVFLGILEHQDEMLRVALTSEMACQIPLTVFAEQMPRPPQPQRLPSSGCIESARPQHTRTRILPTRASDHDESGRACCNYQ